AVERSICRICKFHQHWVRDKGIIWGSRGFYFGLALCCVSCTVDTSTDTRDYLLVQMVGVTASYKGMNSCMLGDDVRSLSAIGNNCVNWDVVSERLSEQADCIQSKRRCISRIATEFRGGCSVTRSPCEFNF